MNMRKRHAYLIMAHHRPDLLQMLINAIDDERNDIFVHIDKKSNMQIDSFSTEKAKLFMVERIDVKWAGYSQVECEYRLLEAAVKSGEHAYYHFMTGVTYPLWNQDYLHEFFSKHSDIEFIGYDNLRDYSNRARYYWFLSEYGKLQGIKGRVICCIRDGLIGIQKLFRYDRLKSDDIVIKKGCAYWSITEPLTHYILNNERYVKKLFNNTIWCDEVFVQTLAYNSPFRHRIYNLNDEYDGAMREFAWPSNVGGDHPGWNFKINDLNYLINSKRLFALKFETPDGISIINEIQRQRNI